MLISPLPVTVIRQLGPASTITSPVSVIKELLDNSLDAGATSVDMIVSPNTLDRVEVRDNGDGIHPDDHDALGRPGHTSKLRSFDQLHTLGGKTLGFRGAALASINAVAAVSVTTRRSSEAMATVAHLHAGGGVAKREHRSAPVGTTVLVEKLFSNMPVRFQLMQKQATKTIVRVKELLQSYALARPQIRLQFRVLKSPQLSWSYHAKEGGDVREAILQVFGSELLRQCKVHTLPAPASDDRQTHLSMDAVFPRPDADMAKVDKGPFFSVDARPVSAKRGTMKKLLDLLRQQIGRCGNQSGKPTIANGSLFVCLDITCPPGSYDPNVEPSKDDVLFGDEQFLVDRFAAWISGIYSLEVEQIQECEEAPCDAAPCNVPRRRKHSEPWRMDMSAAVDRCSSDSEDKQDKDRNCIGSQPQLGSQKTLDAPVPDASEDAVGDRLEGLNPWSLAKLAAPRRNGILASLGTLQDVSRPASRTRASTSQASAANLAATTWRDPNEPQSQKSTGSVRPTMSAFIPAAQYRCPTASREPSLMQPVQTMRPDRHDHGLFSPPSSTRKNRHPQRLHQPSSDTEEMSVNVENLAARAVLKRLGRNPLPAAGAPLSSSLADDAFTEMSASLHASSSALPFARKGNINTFHPLKRYQRGVRGAASLPQKLFHGNRQDTDWAFNSKGTRNVENLVIRHLTGNNRLPLEWTPSSDRTQGLFLAMRVTQFEMVELMEEASAFDGYLAHDDTSDGIDLDIDPAELAAIESRLRYLLADRGEVVGDIILDLSSCMRGKAVIA